MNKKTIPMKILCSLLATFLVIGGIPAFAAEPVLTTSSQEELSATQALVSPGAEFDYSGTDDLNKFDEYEKKIDETTGLQYVDAPLKNRIGTLSNLPSDWGRYGAFLRSEGEIQTFSFILSMPLSSTRIQDKYLTVYADEEVDFTLKNTVGDDIARSDGWYNNTAVKRYKKSTDGDNYVYFIELIQPESSGGRQFIQFTTTSSTVQPHYSYWFGNPLVKEATASGGTFTVSATSPNRSSSSVSVRAPSVPELSWIKSIVLTRTSTYGDANMNYANLAMKLQDGRTFNGTRTSTSPMTIEANCSATTANPASGSYSVYMSYISWKTGTAGSRYSYSGKMTVNYLYAFGV